jgi:hypothetical protein
MDNSKNNSEGWIVKFVHLVSIFSQVESLVDKYTVIYGVAPASYIYLLELLVRQMSVMLDGDVSILQKLNIYTKEYMSKNLEDKGNTCPDTCDELLKKTKVTVPVAPKKVDPADAIIDKYLEKKTKLEGKKKHDKRRKAS